MEKTFIRPAQGLRIRMPNGNILPTEGAEVELNSYWLRRLEEGDVDLAPLPSKEKKS